MLTYLRKLSINKNWERKTESKDKTKEEIRFGMYIIFIFLSHLNLSFKTSLKKFCCVYIQNYVLGDKCESPTTMQELLWQSKHNISEWMIRLTFIGLFFCILRVSFIITSIFHFFIVIDFRSEKISNMTGISNFVFKYKWNILTDWYLTRFWKGSSLNI